MFITKTDFIAYTRCPKYAKYYYKQKKLIKGIYDYEQNNKYTECDSGYLQVMLPYYKQLEVLVGKHLESKYKIKSYYDNNILKQYSFCYEHNDYKYLCFVDIYQEDKDEIRIIEVKVTTDNKWSKNPLFIKLGDTYYLKEDLGLGKSDNNKNYSKLFDIFGDGNYIYDLAIQKWIIDNSLLQKDSKKKVKYLLAMLNHKYVYDGTKENGEAIYNDDKNGNSLIVYFDLTRFLEKYMPIIEEKANYVENELYNGFNGDTKLGKWCGLNTNTECPLISNCMNKIPNINSVLSYKRSSKGFILNNKRIKGLELINEGYYHLLDIPDSAIVDKNHEIQRMVARTHQEYINKDKIKKLLDEIEYPIYYLDFETFPCPLPRYRGESPYTQSVFEFSLHIERSPGKCDKVRDHILYLAPTHEDCRKAMLDTLFKYIDPNKGTLLAQNVAFERGRLLELANIFPEYHKQLVKLANRTFDLLWLLDTNTKKYIELGYNREDARLMNYYHESLNGSFSIKKTLALFSDLSYDDLAIHNGNEAIITYAKYPLMSDSELEQAKQNLYDYCKQDTWAMVLILDGLREKIRQYSKV